MTRDERAREVVEALDPLAVGEEVWFFPHDMFGNREARRRGVVMNVVPWRHADIAVGPLRGTMPTFRVCFDDIMRDK